MRRQPKHRSQALYAGYWAGCYFTGRGDACRLRVFHVIRDHLNLVNERTGETFWMREAELLTMCQRGQLHIRFRYKRVRDVQVPSWNATDATSPVTRGEESIRFCSVSQTVPATPSLGISNMLIVRPSHPTKCQSVADSRLKMRT